MTDDPVSVYLREVSVVAPLTDEEACEFLSAWPISEVAKQRLVEGSLCQVVSIARGFESSGKPILDLITEGNVGLLTAVETVSASERTHFSHYVRECVEQQIRRFIAGA